VNAIKTSWLVLSRSAASLFETAGTRAAAQVAYYLVMSFPAILLLVVWGFASLLDDPSVRDKIVEAIVHVLPLNSASDRARVESLLDEVAAGAGTLGWVGVVSLMYSASGAVGALRYAINDAWGTRELRPYVPGKALDVGVTLVAAPVVIVALGLTLSGALAEKIGDHPWIAAAAQVSVTRVLPLALLFVLLTWTFHVLPTSGARWRPAAAGSLVALAGTLVVQAGYDAYVALAGDANAIYGTLGTLLAIVFSAYLVAIAIVYGAHVAAQASRLPELLAAPAEPHRSMLGTVRGLFVR
jgi:membrane protein